MATETGQIRNLIVVGSGPAGYTAAVYAARAQLAPLVFEGSQFGGALMTTTEVENFPGFAEAIMGPDLMEQMRTQAARFGAELRAEDVESVDLTGPVKYVTVNGTRYAANAVVLAMGAAARYLHVPGELLKVPVIDQLDFLKALKRAHSSVGADELERFVTSKVGEDGMIQ